MALNDLWHQSCFLVSAAECSFAYSYGCGDANEGPEGGLMSIGQPTTGHVWRRPQRTLMLSVMRSGSLLPVDWAPVPFGWCRAQQAPWRRHRASRHGTAKDVAMLTSMVTYIDIWYRAIVSTPHIHIGTRASTQPDILLQVASSFML